MLDDDAVSRARRAPDAHASRPRADHGRDDRPHLRGRFDPRDLRDHRRSVPGVHEQRVRDPGAASLYFALAGAIEAFRYLKVSLALVLALVGVKMLAHSWLKSLLGPSFNLYLLLAVVGILAAGVLASVAAPADASRQRS